MHEVQPCAFVELKAVSDNWPDYAAFTLQMDSSFFQISW